MMTGVLIEPIELESIPLATIIMEVQVVMEIVLVASSLPYCYCYYYYDCCWTNNNPVVVE